MSDGPAGVPHKIDRRGKTMKCPTCGYVSHDYLDACRKCHKDLVMFKRKFHLEVLQPGDLDLSELLGASSQGFGGRVKFSDDNCFFRDKRLDDLEGADDNGKEDFDIELDNSTSEEPPWRSGMPSESPKQASMAEAPGGEAELGEMAAETGVDNQFDESLPDTSGKETNGPGELTRVFYVPDDLADQAAAPKPPDGEVQPDGPAQATGTESSAGNALPISIDGIDIDLDDAFDELEDIELDTSELVRNVEIELDLPLALKIEHASDDDRTPTAISKTSVSDETAEPMLTEAQDEPLVAETSEVIADLASDDLAADELVLEIEEADDEPVVSPGNRTTTS
jgi:hypothetical protein